MEGAGVTGVTGAERPPACSSLPCSSRTVNSTSRATLRTSVRLLHRKLIPSPSMRAKSSLHGQSHQPLNMSQVQPERAVTSVKEALQSVCPMLLHPKSIMWQALHHLFSAAQHLQPETRHNFTMGQNQTYKHWLASWQWQQGCDNFDRLSFFHFGQDLAKAELQAQDRMADT
jgi:hypothetical protein